MALLNRRLYLIILILLLGTLVLAGPELHAQSPLLVAQEFSKISYVQAAPEHATLFTNSFDAGTSSWNLDGTWAIYNDSGNNVLDGQGHSWAWLKIGQNWTDYTFTAGDNGVHTFGVTFNTSGAQSVRVTDIANGSLTGSQAGITVNSAGLPTFLM